VGVNTATNLIYAGLSFGGNAVAVIAECPHSLSRGLLPEVFMETFYIRELWPSEF
jgi:hypothetical protein